MGTLVYSLQVPSTNYNFPANIAALSYFYPGSNGGATATSNVCIGMTKRNDNGEPSGGTH